MSEDASNDSMKSIVLKEVLGAAVGSPEMQKAGRSMGRAVATIAATIDHALLPLAAMNYGIQRAREYFNHKFADEFHDKTKDIPAEYLTDPKPSLAGPALQGLSFSIEEPDLKDLYLNLLSSAVDSRKSDLAHPAFVDVIKQLKSSEARFLKEIIQDENVVPIVRLMIKHTDGGLTLEEPLLTNSVDRNDNSQIYIPELGTTFNNWCRLGLVELDWTHTLRREGAYNWAATHPQHMALAEKAAGAGGSVEIKKGICRPTTFGLRFGAAVGIL